MASQSDYPGKVASLLTEALLSEMMHVARLLRTAHDPSLFPAVSPARVS